MRAQLAGQIFVYIITILIVGIVLLFGYKSISEFRSKADSVSLLRFQKELEASAKSIKNQFGTVKKKDFTLAEFNEVCFIRNYQVSLAGIDISVKFQDYPLIKDAFESNTGKNVFLLSNKEIGESFNIEDLVVENLFQCFDVNNNLLSLTFEGMGDHVVIS